ncbi:hypothetical protein D3C71_1690760 [compost metagenome]
MELAPSDGPPGAETIAAWATVTPCKASRLKKQIGESLAKNGFCLFFRVIILLPIIFEMQRLSILIAELVGKGFAANFISVNQEGAPSKLCRRYMLLFD